MTTYYAAPISDQLRYNPGTWPTALEGSDAATFNVIIGALSDDDELVISGGVAGITYADRIAFSNSVLVRGCLSTDLAYTSHGGLVTVENTVDTITSASTKKIRIKNIKITGALLGYNCIVAYNSAAVGSEIEGVICEPNGGVGMQFQQDASVLYSLIKSDQITNYGINLNHADADVTVRYSSVLGFLTSVKVGNGNVLVSESDLIGSNRECVYIPSGCTGGIKLYNSNILGCSWLESTTVNTMRNLESTATAEAHNCNITTLPVVAGTGTSDIFSSDWTTSNIYEITPGHRNSARPGILSFHCDDFNNFDYFQSQATYAEAYGLNICMGVNIYGLETITEENWATMRTMTAKGHEFMAHANYILSDLLDLEGITVNFGGGDASTATLTIEDTNSDGFADSLSLKVIGGTEAGTYTLDLTSGAYDNLNELVAGIAAFGTFTATNNNSDAGYGRSRYLAPGTYDINGADADIDYSSTALYKGELTDVKATMTSNIGACDTMVCPGNSTDATLQAAIKAAGFIGARGDVDGDITLEDINIYYINERWINSSAIMGGSDPTDADIEREIAVLTEYLKYIGGILCVGVHNASEMTLTLWDKIFSEVANSGVSVMTFKDAVSYLKTYDPSGDLVTEDDMTFTRTVPVSITDKSKFLKYASKTSSGVNAGVFNTEAHAEDLPDQDGNYLERQFNLGTDQGAGATKRGGGNWLFGPGYL